MTRRARVARGAHDHGRGSRRWRGYELGDLDAESVFISSWGAVLVLLVATRNDWPVSLLAVCVAAFYFGVFFGAHLVL